MDNAWRWFFSGILVGAICAGLAVVVIDPAEQLGLRGDSAPTASAADEVSAPGAERTFVLVVDENGKVISQRTELAQGQAALPTPGAGSPATGAPAAPSAPSEAASTPAPPPPPPTPTIRLGNAVMAKVEQPSFLSAREGVAFVATRGLQLKRVNLKGEVSNQSTEGIRDLGGSRIADVDVIANGTLFALVVDGPLEWRLFRRPSNANAWTEVASGGSTAWSADVVGLAATDEGAIYLSATDPGGVFRLEPDLKTFRPWVPGARVLGIDSSGDDSRLLFAAPETSPPRAAEQIRAVVGGTAQRWLTNYQGCPGADIARTAPMLPRDVALLPIVEGTDPALIVDSNHVVWYQERFGEGEPLFGVPCESGSDATHLNSPRAVAIDNLGNVFISDTGNARVVVLPKPGATPTPTPKAKAGATPEPTPAAPAPTPPVTAVSEAPAPLRFVDFGNPGACPNERCPQADVMFPSTVTVAAGETVRFNIRALSHQVAIYTPGTHPDHLYRNVLGGIPDTPGANQIVIDPIRRVSASPVLPFQQPAVTEWDWDTRGLAPGAYLVICTFKPHLDLGMVGSVVVQ